MFGDSYYIQFVTISGTRPSAPQDLQHGTAAAMDLMVEEVRRVTGDTKYSFSSVVRENGGTTSGSSIVETFYTSKTPVLPGSEVLEIGRWRFTPVLFSGDIVNMNKIAQGLIPWRQYVYNVNDASFFLASGVPRTNGETVYISYTWLEPRAPRFSDTEIKLYLSDSIPEIENVFQIDLSSGGYSSGKTLSSISDPVVARILVLNASKLCLQALQESLTVDGIFLKDGDVTIDTTRGLKNRADSLKSLQSQINSIVEIWQLRKQLDYVGRVDTYSTDTSDRQGLINLGQYIEVSSNDLADIFRGD